MARPSMALSGFADRRTGTRSARLTAAVAASVATVSLSLCLMITIAVLSIRVATDLSVTG